MNSKTGIVQNGLQTALVLIGCFDITHGHSILGVVNRPFHEKLNEYTYAKEYKWDRDSNIYLYLFRWKSIIYWGIALPNAKLNNLDNVFERNKICDQRVLIYGSVNVNTFNNILHDWIKLEVAACGKNRISLSVWIYL